MYLRHFYIYITRIIENLCMLLKFILLDREYLINSINHFYKLRTATKFLWDCLHESIYGTKYLVMNQ